MTATERPPGLDTLGAGEPGAPALRAEGLWRHFGGDGDAPAAVRDVSLTVPTGKLTAVLGRPAAGKTVLMHLLAGLDRPTEGRVAIAGHDITLLDDVQVTLLRRRHVGFVFQVLNLLPMLTVEENVLLPLRITGEAAERGWLEDVLRHTGLTARREQHPPELSDGTQQRVALARALVSRPTVLLADEPTGTLDGRAATALLGLLRDATDLFGQTTVLFTRESRAAAIADRVVRLEAGRIVSDFEPLSELHVQAALEEPTG